VADTPLPTVEAVLMEALEKGNLIEEGKGWDGCGFARCGRTDRGVSAAGQVVSLWVKSRLEYDGEIHEQREGEAEGRKGEKEKEKEGGKKREKSTTDDSPSATNPTTYSDEEDFTSTWETSNPKLHNKTLRLELPYLHILNKLLPPTIRILAWSPLSPTSDFDARYSCTHRHYKYFFSLNANPAGVEGAPDLDLEAMREAAGYLVGEHDFRNLCKVDGSKQITDWRRAIYSATISPVEAVTAKPFTLSPYSHITPSNTSPSPSASSSSSSSSSPPPEGSFFVFDLLGRAFLYHQVRHIMAILFLVGARLESPSVVKDLLAWPTKPTYEMADGAPLLLWDCGFPEGMLDWRYGSTSLKAGEAVFGTEEEGGAFEAEKFGYREREGRDGEEKQGGEQQKKKHFIPSYSQLSDSMIGSIHSSHLDTLLHSHFHASLLRLNPTLLLEPPPAFARRRTAKKPGVEVEEMIKTPTGGNSFKIESAKRYPKLETRVRGEDPLEINRKWSEKMERKWGKGGRPKKIDGVRTRVVVDDADE
jgi:tRNA U38,U39,U40 pseudouridine synthase TruA